MNTYSNWRTKIIWLVFIFSFVILSHKLFQLMTVDQEFLSKQGQMRSDRVAIEYASRGQIIDRNERVLAESLPSAHVSFNKKDLAKFNKHRKKIVLALKLDPVTLMQKIKAKNKHVVLKRWLSPDELMEIRSMHLPFLQIEVLEKRYYPMSEATSSLLGIVNAAGYGQEGLERAFDKSLQSIQGRELVEKNRKGEVVQIKSELQSAKISSGVKLTIDSDIQAMVYNELTAGLKKYGAESGSVIVISPSSGQILAMANAPGFNPNNSATMNIDNIRNQALMDLFEPGSTIKPFTIAAALASKKYNENSMVDTGNGTYNLYGYTIKDETHMHGLLSLANIIKKSSNVAITKIGLSLPNKLLPDLLLKLGFTVPALNFPGEASGRINSRAWNYKVEQAALAYGYGMNASAVQLAHAYAILANHGVDAGVHIVKDKSSQAKSIISPKVADTIVKLLEGVVEPGGTAHAASIKGVRVAGKTGTTRIASQGAYKKRAYVATFVGIFPAEKPKWVVLVVVNRPNLRYYFGGRSAAPIFANIGKDLLRLQKLDRDLDLAYGKI